MPPKRKSDGSASATKRRAGPELDPALEEALEKKIKARSTRWARVSASKNLDAHYLTLTADPTKAYAWKTVCRPGTRRSAADDEDGYDGWEDVDSDDDEEEDEEEDDSKSKKKKCDGGKTCPCGKLADELPSHPYVFTGASLIKQRVASGMLDVRDPDTFEMYTYNDHASYGALEVLRNMMVDFDEAYKANDWREMWVIIETLPLYLLFGGGDSMSMCDDGATVEETVDVLLRAPMAALAALEAHAEAEGENAWQPRNLGWIMSLWLDVAESFREQSLLEDSEPTQAETFVWNPANFDLYLVATAKRRGITLTDSSSDNIDACPTVTMPDPKSKNPWGWSAAFQELRAEAESTFGGDSLDVTTWTSAERKAAAFNKRSDPISASMMKKIKEGMVMMLE